MSEDRVDPYLDPSGSGATLVPVDHDPFTEPPPQGYLEKIGHDLADFWQQPVAHVKQRLSDIGQSFTDVARGGLESQAGLLSRDYSTQPLIGLDPQSGELTGRVPAFADIVRSGLAGPVPGGGAGVVLGAGPRVGRAAGALETPIDDTLKAAQFAADLRTQHLAREDGLPLSGAQQPVSPPPHIQTPEDMDGLVNRYAGLAETGAAARDWYAKSGQAILAAAGNPEAADRFAAALAVSSPRTSVADNAAKAVTLWNQAMTGEPVLAVGGQGGRQIGARAAPLLYQGAPITGEKTGPFHTALGLTWNPDPQGHPFVNDIWNMRAAEYPPELGAEKDAAYYTGAPSLGQHNFTRILADRAADVLNARTGEDWRPEQIQAAVWAGKKADVEGTPVGDAAFNFADALKSRFAQQSWESAPGETAAAHLPEYHQAAPIDQEAYHTAIRGVLEDPQGRDLITPSFQGPGVFEGRVRPGSQAQSLAGAALQGGYLGGVDPSTRDLLTAAEATRGLLLRQDASAWHMPAYRESLKPGDSNMVDVDIGRGLDAAEARAVVEAMHQTTGSDFFSPIATQNGFRLLNVPAVSGIKNIDFQKHVAKALDSADFAGVDKAELTPAFADNGYLTNDWGKQGNGQGYLEAIAGTGRPDLQRRSAELLAALGPRVSQIEEHFAQTHGWSPDRGTRVWETSPQIQQYGVVPNPPRPWRLIPVDHDPFAGAPPAF
jgi:hypothetical protein